MCLITVGIFTPLEKVHPVEYIDSTYSTGQADFNPVRDKTPQAYDNCLRQPISNGVNRWSLPIECDGGLKPKADPPLAEKPPLPQTVKELRSLTGFTLIELIMVIIIIGILATISIPHFINLRDDAKRGRCKADVQALEDAISNWHARWLIDNVCPSGVLSDCDANGFPVAEQLQNDSTYLADNFIVNGKFPPVSHITASSADWSTCYNPGTGSIDIDSMCP